jgi:hypothetical protein
MPTPVIILSDYESAKTYFEGLVQAHKLTNELVFGYLDQIEKKVKGSTKGVTVWLEPWDKTNVGDPRKSNNFLAEKKYGITFMAKSPTDKFDDEHATYIMLEGIARDFMSKVIKDSLTHIVRINLNNWDYGRTEDVTMGSTKYVACLLNLNHYHPEDTEYKPDNWN